MYTDVLLAVIILSESLTLWYECVSTQSRSNSRQKASRRIESPIGRWHSPRNAESSADRRMLNGLSSTNGYTNRFRVSSRVETSVFPSTLGLSSFREVRYSSYF